MNRNRGSDEAWFELAWAMLEIVVEVLSALF